MSESDDFQQRPIRIDEGTPGVPIEEMSGGRRRSLNVLPMSQQAGRMPPQATEVEQSVLGAMLVDAEACARAVALLGPDEFYEPRHALVFGAAEELFASGRPVDLVTLTEELKRRGDYDRVGGYYLTELTTHGWTAANVEYHARIVSEKALLRRFITAMTGAVGRAFDPTTDPFELLDRAARDVSDLVLGVARGGDTHVRHAVAEALVRVEDWRAGRATDYAPSGFWGLDQRTGGLPVGEVTTLAAMTGAGKTALLGWSVRSVALAEVAAVRAGRRAAPRPVVVFSAEMSREQIAHRIASGIAGLDLNDLRSGRATEAEYRRYDAALGQLAGLEVHVDDEPEPTFTHIAARLTEVLTRARAARGDADADGPELALVGVDYDEKIHTEGRTEELRVSAIAQGLKVVAKRFRCPVLALSQYGRKEGMHRKRPDNSWLRYSGKKEQEAAQIIHWIWPRYWVDKGYSADSVYGYDAARPDRGYLFVSKNRQGAGADVALDFHPPTVSFRDPNEPGHRYSPAELARRPPTHDPEAGAPSGDIYSGADPIPPTDHTPF